MSSTDISEKSSDSIKGYCEKGTLAFFLVMGQLILGASARKAPCEELELASSAEDSFLASVNWQLVLAHVVLQRSLAYQREEVWCLSVVVLLL